MRIDEHSVIAEAREIDMAVLTHVCAPDADIRGVGRSRVDACRGSDAVHHHAHEEIGYLFVLTTESEVEAFRRSVALQNTLGVPSRMIAPEEARELSPLLAGEDVLAASYCPTDAHATPESVVQGYASGARRHGAHLAVSTPVQGIDVANGVISHNCYARPNHEYLDMGAGTDFDTKIVVKPRAAELLREAFASGRPVVATTIGDVPEIIKHGENGLMVEPGNVEALAAAILQFLSDEELATRCATNALRYARENFCFDRMMEAKVEVDLALTEQSKARKMPVSAPVPLAPSRAPVVRASNGAGHTSLAATRNAGLVSPD